MILPEQDLIEESKIRLGVTVRGSWRNGAILTLIEPEVVFRRSSAGAFDDKAGWGTIVISIEPDIVVMERRSCSAKAPVMLFDISLMTVERDMIGDRTGGCWTKVDVVFGSRVNVQCSSGD